MTKIKICSKTEGFSNFEWPQFNHDRDRIRFNSMQFKGVSIEEAFLGKSFKGEPAVTPHELKVGEIINVSITSVTKNSVVIGDAPTKQEVVCKNNLGRYRRFKETPYVEGQIRARVIESDSKRAVVDVLQPIFEDWINPIIGDVTSQCVMAEPRTIMVENLQQLKNGFSGKVSVPTIEEFLGEKYYIEAFIPGSHIVQNIEEDFTRWIGQSVEAFVINYVQKPGPVASQQQMSLVCSRKNLLVFEGNRNLIDMFRAYCDQGEVWKNLVKYPMEGKVTGVINSSRKCGVFVEVGEFKITGMINMKAADIVRFRPFQKISVTISGFEDMSYIDPINGFRYHHNPYEIEDGILRKCILKPVLKLVSESVDGVRTAADAV